MKQYSTIRTGVLALLLMVAGTLSAQQDSVTTWPIDTVNGTAVWRYKAEKSIGLFRISKNFGVTQEEIIQWNPQLRDRGLHLDEELLIPVSEEAKKRYESQPAKVELPDLRTLPSTATAVAKKPVEIIQPAAEIKADSLLEIGRPDSLATIARPDSLIEVEQPKKAERPVLLPLTGEVMKIAYLLPLQAEVAQRDPGMDRFYEFYTGALLAVHDAQSEGLKVEVRTYDIGKSNERLEAVLNDSSLWLSDAIIGPAFPSEIAIAAPYALEHQTPMLFPFAPYVQGIEDNPYLMLYNSSDEDAAIATAQYIAGLGTGVKCIEVEAKEEDIPGSIRDLRNALRFYRVPSDTTTIRAILNDSLEKKLSATDENILIFNTERYSNLHVLMPHLISLTGRYKLTLLSRYAWQKENVALPQLYCSSFRPDTAAQDSVYTELYRHYFQHLPKTMNPRYDLLGYDLTRYMLLVLPQLKENAEAERVHEIIGMEYEGKQSDIRFERVSENGGYRNKALKMIRN